MDARPADAAGRLRYDRAVELVRRSSSVGEPVPADAAASSRKRRASTATTTSRRAWRSTYDLFGNGKTALKANLGKYLEATITASNYGSRTRRRASRTNVTRNWTDSNGNFAPDCDLLNPAAQDFARSGGDFCGAISNLNFGNERVSNTIDPAILKGWGVRPSDWAFGVSVQQEVLPRVSVEVGYFRRWFQGFIASPTTSRSSPSDFAQFSITAPLDSRLPGGGGYRPSGRLLRPSTPGAVRRRRNNYITSADNLRHAVPAVQRHRLQRERAAAQRPDAAGRVQLRPHDGRHLRDPGEAAGVGAAESVLPRRDRASCRRYKLLGSYMIPKIDVQTSVDVHAARPVFR